MQHSVVSCKFCKTFALHVTMERDGWRPHCSYSHLLLSPSPTNTQCQSCRSSAYPYFYLESGCSSCCWCWCCCCTFCDLECSGEGRREVRRGGAGWDRKAHTLITPGSNICMLIKKYVLISQMATPTIQPTFMRACAQQQLACCFLQGEHCSWPSHTETSMGSCHSTCCGEREAGNSEDFLLTCRDGAVVGHMPREYYMNCWHFPEA